MAPTVKAAAVRTARRPSSASLWTVTVGFTFPSRPGIAQHPKFYDGLSAVLVGRGAAFKQTATQLIVNFGSAESSYKSARRDADGRVTELLRALDLKADSVKDIRLTANDDLDKELSKLPTCVGVGEAADILGVSKQRVAQLALRDDFPTPLFRLRATPVWRDRDIRKFASSRQTTPGPAARERA